MGRFHRKRHVSFRRPDRNAFRLDTEDITDGRTLLDWLFGWWMPRRDGFSRYITAGGTRDTRGSDGEEASRRRSWHRFAITLTVVVLVWILGMLV